ncbi:MAG: hypothetical protein EA397_19225 [Deltaproteobacteria bacterium]|nr:MAG: hypothetical protein EA397_19225 [Deltaproteobacteria bacterium]
MPLSPHLERFELEDEGAQRTVALIAAYRSGEREVVLLLPDDADEHPGEETDAWIRLRVVGEGGVELEELDDDALISEAWAYFDEVFDLSSQDDLPRGTP